MGTEIPNMFRVVEAAKGNPFTNTQRCHLWVHKSYGKIVAESGGVTRSNDMYALL